ncbi:hypothetical protein MHYP_G00354030 [Metynnis hypsauchen]
MQLMCGGQTFKPVRPGSFCCMIHERSCPGLIVQINLRKRLSKRAGTFELKFAGATETIAKTKSVKFQPFSNSHESQELRGCEEWKGSERRPSPFIIRKGIHSEGVTCLLNCWAS